MSNQRNMKLSKSLISDAKRRTLPRWYCNCYVEGALTLSCGFATLELAEKFKESIDEMNKWHIERGIKLCDTAEYKIEQAVGWAVGGEKFSAFSDALLYKWTKCPDAKIIGVFE